MSPSGLSIVIPVYGAPEELDHCLQSVAETVPAGVEVIVIDDASPGETCRQVLQRWKSQGLAGWEFCANARNLGFVATANRGMKLARDDVVLLNSDTEVCRGWYEALKRCLDSDALIATATPWTNNGEIASLPDFCKVNPVPPDRHAVAELIAQTGPPVYPEIPTAVGFCMAIARRAIHKVGVFDEGRFGRGYGEENDFSLRVSQAGFHNVLCDDAYVVHLGGRSFGPLGLKPDADSMNRLLERHPGYLALVQAFIDEDPLRSRREQLLDALRRAGVAMG